MRQTLHLFCLLALLPAALWAQQASTDKIVLSDLQTDEYGTYFTVALEGSHIYTAYNMDIIFPEGMSVAYYDGSPDVAIYDPDNTFYPFTKDKKGNITWKHDVPCSYGVIAPRQLRIACYSDENAEFTATSGNLLIIYVEVDNEVYAKSFCPKPVVTVSGIALVERNNTQHIPADFTCRPFASVIAAERTLPLNISAANQIGTLILPFSAALPQGVKAYTCDAVDDENAVLVLTTASKLDACTPYIVYAQNGYSGTISGTVDMTAEYPATDVYNQGFLTGVLSATVVNDGYIMQNQGDGPMFYDAEGSSFSLPAGRCYLTPTGAAASKAYALRIGETSIDNSQFTIQNSQFIYDLTGRRVVNPTRGIYIYNGKKMVVK